MLKSTMTIRNEDKQAYSQTRTILGNLGILLWMILSTVAVWFFNSLNAWIFLFFTFITIFAVIRRSLCKTCAYCKKCTMGSHKLSELVFGKAELGGLSANSLLSRLVVTYTLLTIVPVTFLVLSISQEYIVLKLVVLATLLLFSLFSVLTKRKRESMKK
jgi:hypothetical protein